MYHHTEHGEPPGLCAQSIALLPAHTQLWGQILYKSHLEICWWYSCGRTHHRQWGGRLQRGGGAVSEVGRGQQPVSKCPEDERDRPGLQGWLPFTLHHRLCGGEHQRQKENLGIHITEHLWWTVNTSHQVREVQESMHFFWRLKWVRIPFSIVTAFSRGTLESILKHRTTPWHHSLSSSDRKTLQRVTRMAVRIIWEDGPSYGTITTLLVDFQLLPSGKRHDSIRAKGLLDSQKVQQVLSTSHKAHKHPSTLNLAQEK